MKRMLSLCAAALCLTLALTPTALAADFEPAVPDAKVCYPTAIVRNDDGTELKKIYDLSPEDDPAGIARSDFEKDGYHYTLVDLLRQELPENESRQHTEHVSIESAKKDMESVLALLPQERERESARRYRTSARHPSAAPNRPSPNRPRCRRRPCCRLCGSSGICSFPLSGRPQPHRRACPSAARRWRSSRRVRRSRRPRASRTCCRPPDRST